MSRSLPPGKCYHVFLSYRDTDGDREWVRILADKLKREYSFICCDPSEDFQPGRKIVDNIKLAATSSVKTLLILSKEYLTSYWCNFEMDYIHQMSMETRQRLIIPVLKEDCKIPDHLKPLTYIDATGAIELWMPRLVAAIEASGGSNDSHELYDRDYCYRNLDTVHEVSSRMTCSFKTTRYVPDALNKRHFRLDADLYNDILKEISKSHFFRLRFCCSPWKRLVMYLIILVPVIILTLIIVCGQQLTRHNKKLESTATNNNDSALIGCGLGLALCLLIVLLWPICCCIFVKKKIKWLGKTWVDVNRKLVSRDLIIGYKVLMWSATFKVVFYYYNYQPCLNYMYAMLEREQKKQQENEDVATKTYESASPTMVDAENILIDLSANYIQDFIYEKLSESATRRHTSRAMCLCEYAEWILNNPDNTN